MISLLATLALSLGLFLLFSYDNQTFLIGHWQSESIGLFALNMAIVAVFSVIQIKYSKTR